MPKKEDREIKQVQVSEWWNAIWHFRLPIEVNAAGYERYDKLVEVKLNFTKFLNVLGKSGTFAEDSIRVVSNQQDAIMDKSVAFQFDQDPDYDATTRAKGTLIFILKGTNRSNITRSFHVYFDLADGSFSPPLVLAQVTLTDHVQHEEQESFKIVTQNATYYYHKLGAGFASMEDADGNDWIGYHPWDGSAGNYRGIPNLVDPEGYFHPGNTGCTSKIVRQGPIKLKIFSESNDRKWACTWEIYPYYAKLTVLKVAHPYWFLYEGTPGGKLDIASDYCMRSIGERTPASQSWDEDIPEPEWLYFGAGNVNRVLYLIHHQDDDFTDSYWPMENNMTVFGFGRKGLNKYLKLVPAHFTIGFAENGAFPVASKVIEAAYRDLVVTLGKPEARPGGR